MIINTVDKAYSGAISMIIIIGFVTINSVNGQTGNVGIGVENPVQKLAVDGAIQIGMDADISPEAGTIRWNPETGDFEGYTGSEWKSLTDRGESNYGIKTNTENARVIPSAGESGDQFGWSVATDGDYAIVGAYGDEDDGFDSGAAYIFKRTGNSWVQHQKLKAADVDPEDWFGYSVSISGNYAVIGAPYDEASGSFAGSAYIFMLSGDTWVQQSKLTAPDGSPNDYMGASVDISGDYCVIGALEDDDDFEDSGSAYIFRRTGELWILHDKLTASDPDIEDRFGTYVAIDGNYCVVGAPDDDDNGSSSGSAYVFHRVGNDWSEQDKLVASDGNAGDKFGFSAAIEGDKIVIGAHATDHSGLSSGSVYVFNRSGTTWTESQVLIAQDASTQDWFGIRVAITGDFILVSAVGYSPDEIISSQGCGYIFKYSGTNWVQQSKLMATAGSNQDELGRSVALSQHTAVIGAPGEATAGGAYFYYLGD